MVLRRNVLVFHTGALGDFVLNWPLAMALGRLHPQSRIVYVTHAAKGKLAEKALRVESIDVEAGWHQLYHSADALPAPAAKWLAGAHTVYSFVADEADVWTREARKAAGEADVCCLKPTPPADYVRHASDYLLDQLAGRKAVGEAVRQMVHSLGDRGLGPARPDAAAVAIHPGSGSRDKCWPAENFLELAARFRRSGAAVRVLLGEVELERWDPALLRRFEAVAEVVTPATFVDLMDRLRESNLFVGNDSGPGHLAGVLGLRTYSLFGPTNPDVWRPLGPRVEAMKWTGVDELWNRINGESP